MAARLWFYWLEVYHLAYRQHGSASAVLYLDPPADALADVALASHQGGYASAYIESVNGYNDKYRSFHYAEPISSIRFSLRAMGGPSLGSINATGARIIIRENEGGRSYPRSSPQQSIKSIVYDNKTGNIIHTEEAVGSAERLADFSGGKLDAQAHDYVRKELNYERKFSVMPVLPDFAVGKGQSFKVDVKKKILVPVKVKTASKRLK